MPDGRTDPKHARPARTLDSVGCRVRYTITRLTARLNALFACQCPSDKTDIKDRTRSLRGAGRGFVISVPIVPPHITGAVVSGSAGSLGSRSRHKRPVASAQGAPRTRGTGGTGRTGRTSIALICANRSGPAAVDITPSVAPHVIADGAGPDRAPDEALGGVMLAERVCKPPAPLARGFASWGLRRHVCARTWPVYVASA